MNNLISFWLAPLTAFFHPRVYRDAAKSRGGRGLLYNLYLAGFVTVVIMIIFANIFVGRTDQFVTWLQKELPVLVWTPQGLSIEGNVQQPYSLVHPSYGPLAVFDMAKVTATDAEMGKFPIFVTSTKIFIRKAPGQIDERDITQAAFQTKQKLPAKVRITGDVIRQSYQNLKRALFFILPIVFLIVFFLFFLVSALLYSLIGLLFNRMRKNKLRYGAIYNVTCFALTASFFLGWVMKNASAAWFLGILINLGYMFFGFKISDQEVVGKK